MLRKCIVAVSILVAAIFIGQLVPAAANAGPSPIDQRYSNSSIATLLGPPTDQQFSVAGGLERDYKWGSLYWSLTTGVYEVHGAIWWKYKALGGPAGFLGFPLTDETPLTPNIHGEFVNVGSYNQFQHGGIVWNQTKATWMGSSIFNLWISKQEWPYWGMPTADQTASAHNSQMVTFTDSNFYTSAATGTHSVIRGDAIVMGLNMLDEYVATGGASGYLGLPTDESVLTPLPLHPGGWVQTYQSGAIFAADDFPIVTHAVHGAIWWAYSHGNGLTTLGYPTTDEQAAPGGRISHFDHGTIFWNATTGHTTITVI